MKKFDIRLALVGFSVVAIANSTIPSAFSQPPAFVDLAPEVRAQINTGTPRKSAEIPDSPFGVHTTYISEGAGDAPNLVKMAGDAGFKWVMDYISAPGNPDDLGSEEANKGLAISLGRGAEYGRLLKANKINLLVRIDFLPFGYKVAGQEQLTPKLRQKIELFTRKIVQDLGPYTNHWQLWNEPNIGNENPLVSPEIYVELTGLVAKTIRQVQPNAVLYGPGTAMLQALAPSPYPWIPRALKGGLTRNIDVFSFHAYRQPTNIANIPEHASEFYPWKIWGTYDNQLAKLREEIKANNNGRPLPLANLEDGFSNSIDSTGEQQISFIVGAKYELRKMLLDFKNGVYPRINFCFYRPIPNPFYESEAAYNMLISPTEAKPSYYAAQNLTAVLDSSYTLDTGTSVQLATETTVREGDTVNTQVYSKRHPATNKAPAFTELLIFFWNAQVASDTHQRIPASIQVAGTKWQSPLLIDLMSMPAPRVGGELQQIINPDYKSRLQPLMPPTESNPNGLKVSGLQLRDYPQLLKLIRFDA